jgi:hypothetical protein
MQTHLLKGHPVEVQPLAEPITAIRIFRIDYKEMMLTSTAMHHLWLPNEVKESVCDRASSHGPMPPVADCSCGIWSCTSRKSLTKAFPGLVAFQTYKKWHSELSYASIAASLVMPSYLDYEAYISARVQIWGIIIKHEWGYRSQFAKIIPESIAWWPRAHGRTQTNLLRYLRQKYQGEFGGSSASN